VPRPPQPTKAIRTTSLPAAWALRASGKAPATAIADVAFKNVRRDSRATGKAEWDGFIVGLLGLNGGPTSARWQPRSDSAFR